MNKSMLIGLALVWMTGWPGSIGLADDPTARLSGAIKPWLDCLVGRTGSYVIEGKAFPVIDAARQEIAFRIVRYDEQAFDFDAIHAEYSVRIRRRSDAIAFAVPKHKVVFMGRGASNANDHLAPEGALGRLIGPGSSLAFYANLLSTASAEDVANTLLGLTKLSDAAQAHTWTEGATRITFVDGSRRVLGTIKGTELDLKLDEAPQKIPDVADWPGMAVKSLPRDEMEQQLARGIRRTCEVLAPSRLLMNPTAAGKKIDNGELRWIDGQRVVLLHGTPEQIGWAHGQLLKQESMRCIDSVLNAFGTVQTVVNGRWFREDLENAYARLAPHIPEQHKQETRALAKSLGLDPRLVETVNVFPELFHCSGFALFGKATKDGKLYHGRVLDYMTAIGLQDSATTFIVAVDDRIPFANVGYAGFIGSVSGMNAQQISLGEMGGRGEGKWDGAPMATLMRRGLEECSTLAEVKKLWQESPRTCEYYYVFADGKDRRAVGVAATPELLEFIDPGQSDPRLGDGIADAVVLSAGTRLEELRRRVKQKYGEHDVATSQWLMCRPVAMESNLHNVLFVPEDGLLYVANADHKHPAADRPYARLDLNELLRSMKAHATGDKIGVDASFEAFDTLSPVEEARDDSRKCLEGLTWQPGKFDISFEKPQADRGDWLVRFPSARPSGDPLNDVAAMEWYQAKNDQGQVVHAPAAVIVHESGSGMTVGRMIAKGLRQKGLHTFMIQLPYYGVRRDPENKPNGEKIFAAMHQSIADVRRARDAVAAVPHVDATRISLQGTSLGGFVTATTAGLDHGFHRVIIFLAGGDLYDVLMQGKQDAANMRRDFEEHGVGACDVKKLLWTIEPLRLAHRMDPDRTWMFSGKFDDVVPLKNANLLADAANIKDSHHLKLTATHYSGIIFLPMVLNQMYDIMLQPATVNNSQSGTFR